MQLTCPQCGYHKNIDAGAVPAAAVSVTCPRCSWRFGIQPDIAQAAPGDAGARAEAPRAVAFVLREVRDDGDDFGPEGRVSFINILALLLLIDATLWLIAHLPDLFQIVKSSTDLPFLHKTKFLYDAGCAIGFFVSAFGLLARKGWARIAAMVLLALALAEGLFLLLCNYGPLSDLDKSFGGSAGGIAKTQPALLLGSLLYGYFLTELNSKKVKSRFSTFSLSEVAAMLRSRFHSIPGHETAQRIAAAREGAISHTESSTFLSSASAFSLGIGYLLFALSLCRPSLVVGWLDGNDTILGYHALYASPFFAVTTLMRGSGGIFHILLGLLLPICNLFVFGSYWLYRYYKKSLDVSLLSGAVVFAAAAWSYPDAAENFPRIGGDGYYLWAASITFISGAFLLRRAAAR